MQALKLSCSFFRRILTFKWVKLSEFCSYLVLNSWIYEGYLPVVEVVAICSHHENNALSLLSMCALSSHWACIQRRNLVRETCEGGCDTFVA